MAFAFITEFTSLGYVGTTPTQTIQAPGCPEVAQQQVAIGVGSAQSAAFNANTKFIRVNVDAVCSIKIGTDPTAAVTAQRMAANQTEFYAVAPGQKIAVIANS